MADFTYPLFPIFAFLGFILSLIPLPWHLQAWNSGTCYYMIWTSLACLNQFINSIVWHGNALNPAPIWCDICAYEMNKVPEFLLRYSCSNPNSFGCRCRDTGIICLHYATAISHFKRPHSIYNSFRGKPQVVPVIFCVSLTDMFRNDVLSSLTPSSASCFQSYLLPFVSAYLIDCVFLSSNSEVKSRIFHSRSSVQHLRGCWLLSGYY